MPRRPTTSLALLLASCADEGPPAPDSDGAAPISDSDPPTDGSVEPGEVDLSLLHRLAGLWSGPATQTPLGAFPLMNVDFRPMGQGLFWGRVDLDPENALRFGYAVEAREPDVLVYRNGGFFLGLLRDDRTVPDQADPAAATWRYCDVDRGCDYIDARYTFSGPDALLFDVEVKGRQHVLWNATRLETREIPDHLTLGAVDPDAPLPPMPELEVTVRWSTPLEDTADAWLILTVGNCLPGTCAVSRSTRAVAEAGATEVVLRFPELHPGPYKMNAILDRDRDLDGTFLPGPGDGVTLPNRPVTVDGAGLTEATVVLVVNP